MRHFNALRWRTRWSRKRARSRSANTGIGQPDLGHEVPAGQLGQHAGVNLVGLGGERGQTLWFHRIGDGHLPAQALEGVVDEARPGHGLDDRADLLAVAQDAIGEGAQGVGVWVNARTSTRPSSSSTCTSSLWRDRSNPTYNMAGASRCWLL